MIRFGLVGCGYWGPNILRVLLRQRDAEVVRVAEPKPGRREFLAREFPGVASCAGAEEVLGDPSIDAVVVATPVTSHHRIGREALLAGKHVLMEKPLAYGADLARDLAAAAARGRRVLMAGHIFQYSPAVEALRRVCLEDGLGPIYYADAARMNVGPPASEVDVVWDLGPHDASILCHLLGTDVESVEATGASYARPGFVDAAYLTLRWRSGIQARAHLSWLSPYRVRRMHIAGGGGAVLYDETEPVEKVRFYHHAADSRAGAADHHSGRLAYGQGEMTVERLGAWEPLEAELRHFMECIDSGREPISGPRVAVKVVEILEAASESIAAGGEARRLP